MRLLICSLLLVGVAIALAEANTERDKISADITAVAQPFEGECNWIGGEHIPPPKQDIYLRIERGPSISYDDKQTGVPVFDMTNRDIDISTDGKHWVHIGNSYCTHKLKKLRIEQ